MKVLVTGVSGQLGFDCMKQLIKNGHDCIASGKEDSNNNFDNYVSFDITDVERTTSVIEQIKPEVVIHCAAYTNVDKAEDEDQKEIVKNINVNGTKNIAVACKNIGAKMIYISTDYVFDGNNEESYTDDYDKYNPVNYYGETKLLGEKIVTSLIDKYFIIRISWVFGINGDNFVKTILNICKKKDKIEVINDQIGTPTYTVDLGKVIADIIKTDKYGYYNITNSGGYISWYDFAKEICKVFNLKTIVLPISTLKYGKSKAKRPFNSRLKKDNLIKNGFKELPTWQDALIRYKKELNIK